MHPAVEPKCVPSDVLQIAASATAVVSAVALGRYGTRKRCDLSCDKICKSPF